MFGHDNNPELGGGTANNEKSHKLCSSFSVSDSTLDDCKYSLRDALHSLTQPCLTAYCIYCSYMYIIQAFYQALQISVSLGKCISVPICQGSFAVNTTA